MFNNALINYHCNHRLFFRVPIDQIFFNPMSANFQEVGVPNSGMGATSVLRDIAGGTPFINVL